MTAFEPPQIEWQYLAPILVVLGAGVVGVLVEAFVPARARRGVQVTLALAATAVAFLAVVWLWLDPAVSTAGEMDLPLFGGTIPMPFVEGVSVLGGSLVADPFGLAVQAIVTLLAFLGILVIADRTSAGQDAFAPAAAAVPGSPYEELARRKGLQQTEAFPLVMFATGGMMIFTATSNLLVMFVALEVLSLPLYVLTALSRRRRLLSQEASFKYFLLGAFASALFIFGVALLYGYTGSVDLGVIFGQIQGTSVLTVLDAAGVATPEASAAATQLATMDGLLLVGLLLILVGLLFKVGAAPFHMWTPDVYQGAPTPVTAYMAACTKAAAFGALVRVLFLTSAPLTEAVRDNLDVALWIVAILTMVIGTVVAVAQTDMKRMLAYSSIAHSGFILIGIIGFAPGNAGEQLTTAFVEQSEQGVLSSFDAIDNAVAGPTSATLFYLLAYGLATLGAFAVVTLVREKSVVPAADRELVAVGTGMGTGTGATGSAAASGSGRPVSASAGVGSDDSVGSHESADAADSDDGVILGEATHLTQWAGLGRRSPWLAGAFSVFLLSMAGIPLTAGFIAKFGAFRAAVEGGATPLAVIGVLASAVAVFFYARIIVLMFFTAPSAGDGRVGVAVVKSQGFTAVAIAVCVVGVVLLGLFPSSVLDLADQAAKFRP